MRLTRDEWRSVGIGFGALIGVVLAALVGLPKLAGDLSVVAIDLAGWFLVIGGGVAGELVARRLARNAPHPSPVPAKDIRLAVAALMAGLYLALFVVGWLRPMYAALGWFLFCFAVVQVASVRAAERRLRPTATAGTPGDAAGSRGA